MRRTAANAEKALVRLVVREAAARRALKKAETAVAAAKIDYAKARPLFDDERRMLVEHVQTGGFLCCKNGLDWLKKRLPLPWAEAINVWAYGALGCYRAAKPEWIDKVRFLALDRFPE